MKTKKVVSEIADNYKRLSSSVVTPKPSKEGNIIIWGLKYKRNDVEGFISPLGEIDFGKATIRVVNGAVEKVKKPIFSSWKKTLARINGMLKDIEANKNNEKVVQQNNLEVFCAGGSAVDKKVIESNKLIGKRK